MRSPIEDANEGAATQVAPSKKHATRTATVAQNQNTNALSKLREVNRLGSALGNSIGKFMQEQQNTENQQRYMKAYHEQGLKVGMEEYQKDLKKTGFTEYIYGGQTPEYQGALNASAKNASNAMMLEEQEYVEGEGSTISPEAYQRRLEQKLTEYNLENFKDAPDAAFAFMSNWQENSNELARQQYKNNVVHLQNEARRTVAENYQTGLSVYKNTHKSNPNRARELGSKLYSNESKPTGMSDIAWRSVLIDESITAIQAGDYSALKLFNESGLKGTLDLKKLKQYQTAVDVVDGDNFDISEAARLSYDTVIENPYSTIQEREVARQNFDSTRIKMSARDTGTAKHIKNISGADRWKGVLGNKYAKRLQDDWEAGIATQVESVLMSQEGFEVMFLQAEDPMKRRNMLADRLDSLTIAMGDPTAPDDVKSALRKQFKEYKEKMDEWKSKEETDYDKFQDTLRELEIEDRERQVGVKSLLTGGGYIAGDPKSQKLHTRGAVDHVLNQIIPDKTINTIDKLEQTVGDPRFVHKFIRGVSQFQLYAADSPEINTAVRNLAVNLRAELTPDNKFTEAQKAQASSLEILKKDLPQVYRAAFSAEERRDNRIMMRAIEENKGVSETVGKLNQIDSAGDLKPIGKLNGQDLIEEIHLTGAEDTVQMEAYNEYLLNLSLGESTARRAAKEYALAANVRADGIQVIGGNTFEPIAGHNLDSTMKALNKTYSSKGIVKSGLSRVLQLVNGGSTDVNGNEISNIKQLPNIKVSTFQGGLLFELNGRSRSLQRYEIERELNDYNEWYTGTKQYRNTYFETGKNTK